LTHSFELINHEACFDNILSIDDSNFERKKKRAAIIIINKNLLEAGKIFLAN